VPTLELFVLLLLLTANGVPILVHLVLGERWGWPLDGGWQFIDGQPLLGASKTVVGVVGALLASTLLALFLDLGWVRFDALRSYPRWPNLSTWRHSCHIGFQVPSLHGKRPMALSSHAGLHLFWCRHLYGLCAAQLSTRDHLAPFALCLRQ